MTTLADGIYAGYYQCPVCGEVEYILVIDNGDVVYCLSCGYDGSQIEFVSLK